MKKKQEIIDMMESDQPLFLLFYATDCTRQKEIKTTLRSLQKSQAKDSFQLESVDVNKQTQLVDDLEIEGLPAVVLYRKGEEIWRRTGQVSEEIILNGLSQLKSN